MKRPQAKKARSKPKAPTRRSETPLQRLHQEVTSAIIEAEYGPQEGELARARWVRVAECEARIAAITPIDALEGMIARRGVVSAFLSAGYARVACLYAGRYFREALTLPDPDRTRFRENLEEALHRLPSPGTPA